MKNIFHQEQVFQKEKFMIKKKKIVLDYYILIGHHLSVFFFQKLAISKLRSNKLFSFTLKQTFTSDIILKCFISGE